MTSSSRWRRSGPLFLQNVADALTRLEQSRHERVRVSRGITLQVPDRLNLHRQAEQLAPRAGNDSPNLGARVHHDVGRFKNRLLH